MRKDGFHFKGIVPPLHEDAIEILCDTYSIESYVEYINKNKIEQARIVMYNLDFLKRCPSLKYLNVRIPYDIKENFSFTPLYEMPRIKFLNCDNEYGEQRNMFIEFDCSRVKGLEYLRISYNKGVLNLDRCYTLKTLIIREYKTKDRNLTHFLKSEKLDSLELTVSNIQSLDGIEELRNLQCLYLYYNRSLKDISALRKVKNSLKTLVIDSCGKVEDFSVLGELENLESLTILGNNKIPNLDFLKSMRKLKTFHFNINVLDGNLKLCLSIPCVACIQNRRHYNLKDTDLPKGEYWFGNENIEVWRRTEWG